jgi:flagellar motor protein MotB
MIQHPQQDITIKQSKSNAWMLSFVDTLSILITFFILIYASSNQKNYLGNFKSEDVVFIPEIKDLSFFSHLMQDKINKYNLEQYFCLHQEAESLTITIDAQTLFTNQSSALSAEANSILSFISQSLNDIDNNIINNTYVAYDQEKYDKEKFKLPLNRAIVLAWNLQKLGYEKNIETKGLIKNNKIISNKCHLNKSQVVDIVINEQSQ